MSVTYYDEPEFKEQFLFDCYPSDSRMDDYCCSADMTLVQKIIVKYAVPDKFGKCDNMTEDELYDSICKEEAEYNPYDHQGTLFSHLQIRMLQYACNRAVAEALKSKGEWANSFVVEFPDGSSALVNISYLAPRFFSGDKTLLHHHVLVSIKYVTVEDYSYAIEKGCFYSGGSNIPSYEYSSPRDRILIDSHYSIDFETKNSLKAMGKVAFDEGIAMLTVEERHPGNYGPRSRPPYL